MLPALQMIGLLLIAATALVAVLTREPVAQTVVISFYGILMAVLFVFFQAPDVALSQIVIGAVVLPLMILLALAKIKKQRENASKD